MANTPTARAQTTHQRHRTEDHGGVARWYGAFDAMAPYLIVLVAVAVARYPFASTMPALLVGIGAAAILAAGTGVLFFRDMSDAHLTWPVAFALFILVAPFLTLHASLEHSALNSPVPVHLLPLVFTWTGILIASLLIAGCVYTMAADHPGWAGMIVAPNAMLVGSVAATSVNVSQHGALTALLVTFAIAEVAAGVGWLVPERYRWFLIPAVLAIGALTTARIVLTTSHHVPGRWLLLGDAGLATMIGLVALGSPFLCRWLTGRRVTSNE